MRGPAPPALLGARLAREPGGVAWLCLPQVVCAPLCAAQAPMHAKTRDVLAAFYRPHNQRLAALLGDQGFAWEPKH